MVTLGIDAHKRTHTIVAVDQRGRQLAVKTIGTNTNDHLALVTWAEQTARRAGDGSGLLWAIEDCRHLSRRLERDLLAAGQSIVRVPPKLMAHVRDSARTYGKSDPIDALAVARAAQREPDLPVAQAGWPGPRCAFADRPSGVAGRGTDPGDLPAALAPARARSGLGTQHTVTGPGQRFEPGRGAHRWPRGDGRAPGTRPG